MEVMEGGIIKQLESVGSTASCVDLLVASRLITSDALYSKALKALIAQPEKPTLDQAKRIGMDAYFEIMARCRYSYPACINPSAGISRQCTSCKRTQ
jgi:hypothetical protein